MDAITIQVLRNKIASLVDEMHYHFYRSGYSTIIRESRDFSCVILDCNGRLIVAPPMSHECLLLPPVKLWEAGEPQPDIERIILTNSRQPALMRGDIHAQIAVTQMGAARVTELCSRFGAGTVTDAFAAILKGAADELRAAITRLPEGAASAEGFLDSDGVELERPIKLAVTIAIKEGIACFDFSDSDPQARGPVNLRPPMVEACVFYSLIGSL